MTSDDNTTRKPGEYYVSKQTDRQWGVYYDLGLGSKLHKMFTTRKEARREASRMNDYSRWQISQQEGR
jgi:hypothetical protein